MTFLFGCASFAPIAAGMPKPIVEPQNHDIRPQETIKLIGEYTQGDAIIVSQVQQRQYQYEQRQHF